MAKARANAQPESKIAIVSPDIHARYVEVRGARTNNLKNITVRIPHDRLTVITGVSGSGKSSLAFETIFAEGQRQYLETLSIYARQLLDQMQRPDVDAVRGLQPTLCIDQRSGTTSPRSTVGTISEVYDYLRLLMARVGTPSCFGCGKPILQQSEEQILATILELPAESKLMIMAPMVRGRRGAHSDVIQEIGKAGLVRARIDGELYELESIPSLDAKKVHSIDAVVDRMIVRQGMENRIAEAIHLASRLSGGTIAIAFTNVGATNENVWQERFFSTLYSCVDCGLSYEEVEPRTFSFNSPYGACPKCGGMGTLDQFASDFVVPNWNLSPSGGAIGPWKAADAATKRAMRREIESLLEAFGLTWNDPLNSLTQSQRQNFLGQAQTGGLLNYLESLLAKLGDDGNWLKDFRDQTPCSECNGSRLRKEANAIKLDGKSITDIVTMSLTECHTWLSQLQFSKVQEAIAKPILSEMLHRLHFLAQVGVGYLSLHRAADTLSGGEMQRVRLATSIGTGLVGVCYILDEPSIGLHQRDNDLLIKTLRDLQELGNTVIVVEHDETAMRQADWLIDIGPGAGLLGGEITAEGTPSHVMRDADSLTAKYLRGELRIALPTQRRTPKAKEWITLKGASANNLQNVDLAIPIGCLTGISGVSGSGKSTLINDTLARALMRHFGLVSSRPGTFRSIKGQERISRMIMIDQAAIGRSPRSTPATYSGVFDEIREVFASTRDSKQRGFRANRFSFNAGPGRCQTCQGQGQLRLEMNFLSDMFVVCNQCNGQRFDRQTLQVQFKGKNIAEILAMSIGEAAEFFENFEKIWPTVDCMRRVGLGYLPLGQSSATLSGGECQRIKLATELSTSTNTSTLYMLDEPTTGLHFEDVRMLLQVLDGLVAKGNSVIVIEHNLDVLKCCDWIVDLGPEGGKQGGQIIAQGTPEAIANVDASFTGKYLGELLDR